MTAAERDEERRVFLAALDAWKQASAAFSMAQDASSAFPGYPSVTDPGLIRALDDARIEAQAARDYLDFLKAQAGHREQPGAIGGAKIR